MARSRGLVIVTVISYQLSVVSYQLSVKSLVKHHTNWLLASVNQPLPPDNCSLFPDIISVLITKITKYNFVK